MTDALHRATDFASSRLARGFSPSGRQTNLGTWLDSLPPIQQSDSVYTAQNRPSFSNLPYADTQVKYVAGGILANQGAYQWNYGNRLDGPPPGATGPMRYSAANRLWFNPTAPCSGPRPNDTAYCDVISKKWVVPSVLGQRSPLSGSVVTMDACSIDPQFPPPWPVGNHGSLECDLRTGRMYADGTDGNYSLQNDYSAIRSDNAFYHSMRTGRDGLKVVPASSMSRSLAPNFSQTVALDRAWTGYSSPAVPFADSRGRLHPSQTGVGLAHHRVRGPYQKNSNVHPIAAAVAQPNTKTPRAGYLQMAMTDTQKRQASTLTAFTPQSFEAINQAFMRPQAGGQLLESDRVIHRVNNQ